MLCTAARGGMRSVVEAYRRDGVFARHQVRLIETHDEGSAARRVLLMCRAYAQFVRLLLGGQVRLVHAHVAMRGSFWRKSLFAATARAFGLPVLVHLHGSELQGFYKSQPAWRQRLIAGQLTAATRVLVLSRSWADFVRQVAPAAKVVVLPNYVSLPPPPAPRLAAPERVELLFLGLVGQRKGVYDLLPALAEAVKLAPQLHLSIGGNGEVDTARQMAAQLGLSAHVDFLGWIGPQDKARLLASAHAYVLPSHNEGLPMSVLEAMSYGLPVLTTRVGGVPELITDGVDGLLMDAGDRAALSRSMVRLAQDPDLRAALGAAARQRVAANYSDAAVLPVLEAVYAEVRAPA